MVGPRPIKADSQSWPKEQGIPSGSPLVECINDQRVNTRWKLGARSERRRGEEETASRYNFSFEMIRFEKGNRFEGGEGRETADEAVEGMERSGFDT